MTAPRSRTQAPLIDDCDLREMPWLPLELDIGESITGTVLRLPRPGAFLGRRLFIATLTDVFGMEASAKTGQAILERKLHQGGISPGDRVMVTFRGWSVSGDGERRYRDFGVQRL